MKQKRERRSQLSQSPSFTAHGVAGCFNTMQFYGRMCQVDVGNLNDLSLVDVELQPRDKSGTECTPLMLRCYGGSTGDFTVKMLMNDAVTGANKPL